MADVEIRQPVPLRTIPGVELAAIGTWKASTGETTFTARDFTDAVAALDCPGVRNPVIKLGHAEEDSTSGVRWDGEPAVGWIANMRFDADGKMRGDLTGVPAWLADADENGLSVIASAYPDRSIEIYRPFVCQIGHAHPSVITALSLLGVYAPGVGVLKSMQDVYAAFTQPMAGDSAKTMMSTLVTMAASEQRELTAAEMRATTDFAKIQQQWDTALDDLLEAWPDISAAQRDELAVQVASAVDSQADSLADMTVDTTAAAVLLIGAMRTVAEQSAAETVAEAQRQGVSLDTPVIGDTDVEPTAAAVTASMGAGLAAAAGTNAAQLLGSGDGASVAANVTARLALLGDGFLREQLGGALSTAQAVGRFSVLHTAPEGAVHYASEVNDRQTCAPCQSIDGAKFESLDQAESAYGAGKYTGCQGRGRCRGQLITVYDGPSLAMAGTVRTTVRMSLEAP